MQFSTIMFGVFAGLTWLIIMLGLAQFARFLKKFDESRVELTGNIAGMAGQLKKLQAAVTELLIEQKKIAKLTEEGVALKQAELTGEFEIIEEPVAGALPPLGSIPAPAEKAEEPPPVPPAVAPAPRGLPRLSIEDITKK